MTRFGNLVLLAACILTFATGCKPPCPKTHLSMDQLVTEHNANARKVPRLWARAKISMLLKSEGSGPLIWGSTSPLASPNGRLLLFKTPNSSGPQNFAIIGYETLAARLFQMGSSVDEGLYYLWYSVGDRRGAWVGRHEFAGAPGVAMPIDPAQLVSVLNLLELPGDFTTLPTVTMRMSCDPCAYVLTYLDRQAVTNRIVHKRDVYFNWDDSKRRRPFLVKLFDATGEQVMTARLADYKPIDTREPTEIAPIMPTDIRITWPRNGSKVHIVLSEMTTDPNKGEVEICRFRDVDTNELPAGLREADLVNVDASLQAGGPTR